jgi:hypothetical protein
VVYEHTILYYQCILHTMHTLHCTCTDLGTTAESFILVDGIQVEKVLVVSQSKSSNVWI